jgi:hypothetical protein
MLASISTAIAHQQGTQIRTTFFFGTGTTGKVRERHYVQTGPMLSRTSSPRSRLVIGERFRCRDGFPFDITPWNRFGGLRTGVPAVKSGSVLLSIHWKVGISLSAFAFASSNKGSPNYFHGLGETLFLYCKTLCITCGFRRPEPKFRASGTRLILERQDSCCETARSQAQANLFGQAGGPRGPFEPREVCARIPRF